MSTPNKTIPAMRAAQDIIQNKITVPTAAKRHGVDRTTIRNTLYILNNGTAEEIAEAWEGKSASKHMADQIRARMTPEQQKTYWQARLAGPKRTTTQPMEVELWAKLMPALRTLTEFPNPQETVVLLKRNHMRSNFIDTNLETAFFWLLEFKNAWRRYKDDKSKDNPVDSGGSNPVAGAQHVKPTTE